MNAIKQFLFSTDDIKIKSQKKEINFGHSMIVCGNFHKNKG